MNYDKFCAVIKEDILEFLPEEYKGYEISLYTTYKVNRGQVTGLGIRAPGRQEAPTLYLEGPYEDYRAGKPIKEVLREIAQTCVGYSERDILEPAFIASQAKMFERFEDIKGRIIIEAVGYQRNRDMLQHVPHQVMGDIAATYRVYLGKEKDVVITSLIDNNLMKRYGVSQKQLHEIALKNSMAAMPAVYRSVGEIVKEILGNDMPEEIKEQTVPIDTLTNKEMLHGASVAFYMGVFEQLGIPIEQYYVLPSSVHELILVPKDAASLEAVNQMVKEVNQSVVDPEEILSDFAHEYDPESKKLVISDGRQREHKPEEPLQHTQPGRSR